MYQIHYEHLGDMTTEQIEGAINDTLRVNPSWVPIQIETICGRCYVWYREEIKGGAKRGKQNQTRAPQVSKKR